MVYAKTYAYLDKSGISKTGIMSKGTQDDSTWTAYDVPDATWLYLDGNNNIQSYTQAQIDAVALASDRAAQSAIVYKACADAITGGFTSSALGSPYTYPSNTTDQQNLAANVLSSLLPAAQVSGWTTPQVCATQATPPVWAYLPHTGAQIQQVGNDGKAWIMSCLLKNKSLQDQIQLATTSAAVQVIAW